MTSIATAIATPVSVVQTQTQTQTIDSFIERYRAAATPASRQAIMHEIHAFRAFEALVAKHGSVEAAQATLDAVKARSAALRDHEVASMGGWGQVGGRTSP